MFHVRSSAHETANKVRFLINHSVEQYNSDNDKKPKLNIYETVKKNPSPNFLNFDIVTCFIASTLKCKLFAWSMSASDEALCSRRRDARRLASNNNWSIFR